MFFLSRVGFRHTLAAFTGEEIITLTERLSPPPKPYHLIMNMLQWFPQGRINVIRDDVRKNEGQILREEVTFTLCQVVARP